MMMMIDDGGGGRGEIRMTCQNRASSCSMGVEEEEEEEKGVVPTLYTRPDYARAIKRGQWRRVGRFLFASESCCKLQCRL